MLVRTVSFMCGIISCYAMAMSGHTLLRFAAVCSMLVPLWSVVMKSAPSGALNETGTVQSSVCTLYIGGFFAFRSSSTLKFQPVVAQTALDHINSLPGILDGYRLEMRWNWTGVRHFYQPNLILFHHFSLCLTYC